MLQRALMVIGVLAGLFTAGKYANVLLGKPNPGPGSSAGSPALGTISHDASLGPIDAAPAPSSDSPVEWLAPLRNYPRPDTFSYKGNAVIADYDPDSLLNARVNVYLERYRPETGVIMIADLRSGHVVAMGERDDSAITAAPRLAFGGGFPAASLIKILTATAALECKAKELTDSIPQLGGFHTLYKRQLKLEGQRHVPRITLEEAFSRSVNPAFGMLGLSLGPEALRATAVRMGFNQPMFPVTAARSRIEFPDSGFSLAEAACGFTAKTTISPWHALQIARGAGDDGHLRPCAFIHRLRDLGAGSDLPLGNPSGAAFVSPENLVVLQSLMQATVRIGTARKGFHSVLKASHLEKIEAGGKTGSLDGEETRGRFDWFIGYARLKAEPDKGLAFSIMLVHREYASIHASAVAALLIRDWLAAHEKAQRAVKAAKVPLASAPDRTVLSGGRAALGKPTGGRRAG